MDSKLNKAGVEPEARDGIFPNDEILTDRQVAAELGVPLATVRYWWTVGRGPPSFKAGRYRRCLRSTFLAWCRERQQ